MNRWFIFWGLLGGIIFTRCSSGPPASLNSPDADLRRQAIIELSNSSDGPKHFVDFIAALEGDQDYLVRAQAAVALGKIKNPQAIPVLLKLLNNPNYLVRVDITNALGEVNDATVPPALVKLLGNDPSPDVRRAAARILGKIDGMDAVEPLITALGKDSDRGVAELAYQSLKQITKQDIPKDSEAWEKWYSSLPKTQEKVK